MPETEPLRCAGNRVLVQTDDDEVFAIGKLDDSQLVTLRLASGSYIFALTPKTSIAPYNESIILSQRSRMSPLDCMGPSSSLSSISARDFGT